MTKAWWYKRYPSDALEGMQGLSLEERGAYNTIIDLIYVRDDRLPDDDRFISGHLGVDPRVWKRLKASLCAKGKLSIDGGFIRNRRASEVVANRVATSVANSVAGRYSAITRAAKSKAKSNENKDMKGTVVDFPLNDRTNQLDIDKKIEKEDKKKEPPIPPTDFALPDWVPVDEWKGWLEMRKKAGWPNTSRSMTLAVNELARFKRLGHNPGKLLDLSTASGWRFIYPGRDSNSTKDREALTL